jgi:hypothetical protein
VAMRGSGSWDHAKRAVSLISCSLTIVDAESAVLCLLCYSRLGISSLELICRCRRATHVSTCLANSRQLPAAHSGPTKSQKPKANSEFTAINKQSTPLYYNHTNGNWQLAPTATQCPTLTKTKTPQPPAMTMMTPPTSGTSASSPRAARPRTWRSSSATTTRAIGASVWLR